MIFFDSKRRLFFLETPDSSYVFGVDSLKYLRHLYYGPKLDRNADFWRMYSLRGTCFAPSPEGTENLMPDRWGAEFGTNGAGDFRTPAVRIRTAGGYDAVDGFYTSHKIFSGKKELPGLPATFGRKSEVDTLEITLADKCTGLEFVLSYSVFRKLDAITRSMTVINRGIADAAIEKCASCTLDFRNTDFDLCSFAGSWGREREFCRTPLPQGETVISSRRGFSGHQLNPFVMLAEKDTCEAYGRVYGAALVYSGSFAAEAERDQYGSVRLTFGINAETFRWMLAPEERFQTPEVVLVFSDRGFEGMTHTFHDLWRAHLIPPAFQKGSRPVLINNWEATYFDFNAEKLLKLARAAKECGIEMLVLDDGWFGKRDHDRCSLGDWFGNRKKLGGSLASLSQKIHRIGLKFGLWFEPEMISPDSDLYRAHPDWCIHIPGRGRSLSRTQSVLDMSREEVVQYLFGRFCDILDHAEIDYIKWDANRNISEPGSAVLPPEHQGELMHRFILGTGKLLSLLKERYPALLIEGCSGGGGRFDAGMLFYTPQIWCSDNSDAYSRLFIQYGTSFCYPCGTMGAHVSICPNHQTGRTTPFATRAAVASAGSFGYELDLFKLTDEERQSIRKQIAAYKSTEILVRQGDYYRLRAPQQGDFTAWSFVSKNGKEFAVTVVSMVTRANETSTFLRLRGLLPHVVYRDDSGACYSGDMLMKAGLPLPEFKGDCNAFTWHFKAKRSEQTNA